MIVESLQSTMERVEEDAEENEVDESKKLSSHINMLVKTLKKVAKELLQVLHEKNRKFYELVNPSQLFSEAPTPLAMPLPEYFNFETLKSMNKVEII